MDIQIVPIWLPMCLEPANKEHKDCYFAVCKEHGVPDQKGQKNYYCMDCEMGPLCEKGFKADHRGHTILQVRKDSWHDVVRIGDISTLFNIDHIQQFCINGNDVVFLPSRPQAKPTKGSPSHCDVCGRSLIHKPARFCSISCKVKAIDGHPRGNSPPAPAKQTARSSSKKDKDAPAMQKKKRTRSPSKKDRNKDAPVPVTKKKRSRTSLKPVSLEDLSLVKTDWNKDTLEPVPKKKRSRSFMKQMALEDLSLEELSISKFLKSADLVLSSYPNHNTNDVFNGHGSSSSQEPLETKFTRYPKARRKGQPQRASFGDPIHLFSDFPGHFSEFSFLEPRSW